MLVYQRVTIHYKTNGDWYLINADKHNSNNSMGDLQDPKLEVLYQIPGHILWGYSIT